jgi:CSLREA domain-containing protein
MRRSLGSALCCLTLLLAARPALAALYSVTTLDDNLSVDSQCSLREAVFLHNGFSAANDCGVADAVPDMINFTTTGVLAVNPSLGEFVLRAPALTIVGPGPSALAIDGQNATPILALDPIQPAVLTVRALTLQHGAARDQGLNCTGGGAIRGRTCSSLATDRITVEEVWFLDNSARLPLGGASGGAVHARGELTARRSRFLRNSADAFSAIFLGLGVLHVEDSSFEEGVGGAIGVIGSGTAVSSIRSSLFLGNRGQSSPSTGSGAAAVAAGGSMLIENSTFQSNEVFFSGAVVGTSLSSPIALTVRNCTFADTREVSPNVGAGVVAVRFDSASTLDLASSLFANNFVPDVAVADGASATLAFNLFDTAASRLPAGTDCAGSTAGGANLCGVTVPGLKPLQANGGPTLTRALEPTSPAVDAGANPGQLVSDQRGTGFPRDRGAQTDIGAFELTPITRYVVNSLADDRAADGLCTLREAIDVHASGGNDCGVWDAADDRIEFAAGLSGTIALAPALGSFRVSPPALEIAGPGAEILAIDGQHAISILLATAVGSRLTVRGLTLSRGHATVQSLGLAEGGAIRFAAAVGLAASLTVEDSVLVDNTAPFSSPGEAPGFGAAISSRGSLHVRRCRFERNQGGIGGAIFHMGGLSIEDSSFIANRAERGGVLSIAADRSAVVLSRNLVRANSASLGAILELAGGKVAISNSTFADNRSAAGTVLSAGPNSGAIGVIVRNSTWAGNGSLAEPGVTAELAGVIEVWSTRDLVSSLSLVSNLFAANQAADLGEPVDTILTATFNLFDTRPSELPAAIHCDSTTVGGGNLCGVDDSGLGPLTPNGGWTQTLPLRAESPAIDAGDNPANLATDQRGDGYSRIVGAAADIGAYEVQGAACQAESPTKP